MEKKILFKTEIFDKKEEYFYEIILIYKFNKEKIRIFGE